VTGPAAAAAARAAAPPPRARALAPAFVAAAPGAAAAAAAAMAFVPPSLEELRAGAAPPAPPLAPAARPPWAFAPAPGGGEDGAAPFTYLRCLRARAAAAPAAAFPLRALVEGSFRCVLGSNIQPTPGSGGGDAGGALSVVVRLEDGSDVVDAELAEALLLSFLQAPSAGALRAALAGAPSERRRAFDAVLAMQGELAAFYGRVQVEAPARGARLRVTHLHRAELDAGEMAALRLRAGAAGAGAAP
jgi:hypothetical protein